MSSVAETHRAAMDYAERAEVARLQGQAERASELFRRAFELEREAAGQVLHEVGREPTRSVLLRSAASLALDCDDPAEAVRLIELALGGNPPLPIARELRDLREQAQFRMYLHEPGSSLLSYMLAQARRAYDVELAALIAELRSVAREVELPGVDRSLERVQARLHGDLFQVFVVGRMKTGKSTLINALLARTDRPVNGMAAEGPLPVNDLPTTAVLTRVHYAEEPYVLAIPMDPDAEAQPWTFADYHHRARIRSDDGRRNEELFDRIKEFHLGWPAELLRNGVTLVDSPGVSEKKERTELTRQAVREADAAIIVFRTEPLAGEDEIAFAQDVTAHAGNVFTLINRREGHVIDAGMEGEIRDKLGIPDERTLEQAEVYPVDLRRAVAARYRGDERGVEASGLLSFERRIARFLVEERYNAHVRKALGELDRESAALKLEIRNQQAALTAHADRVAQVLKECGQDLETIARRRRRIDEILVDAQEHARAAAAHSFQQAVENTARDLAAEAQNRSIPGLAGMLSALDAATLHGKRYLERTVDMLNEVIRDRLRRWAESPPDQPGLQADIQPVLERLVESLGYETDTIDRRLLDVQRRLSNLDPTVSAKFRKDRSTLHPTISHAVSVALFGPAGSAVALGGWHALGAGTAGGLLHAVAAQVTVAVAATVLHVVVAPAVIVGIISAAVIAGGGAGAADKVEERLRKAALEQITPQLRSLATNREQLARIESGVEVWVSGVWTRVTAAMDEPLARERQSLDRIEALSGDQRDRQARLELLSRQYAVVTAAAARIHTLSEAVERLG